MRARPTFTSARPCGGAVFGRAPIARSCPRRLAQTGAKPRRNPTLLRRRPVVAQADIVGAVARVEVYSAITIDHDALNRVMLDCRSQ